MDSTQPHMLAQFFKLNYDLVTMHIKDLTHADSLLQLPFRGNCLNWVLGHIIEERQDILKLLSLDEIWGDDEKAIYRPGSEPITSAKKALPLERLLSDITASQNFILDALKTLPIENFDKKINREGHDYAVGEYIGFLMWHETYHCGQLEILRQLAGKNDALVS